MADAAPLRLRAEDHEDLTVLAACLQDALVAVKDMAYAPDENRFLLVVNRLRWEAPPTDGSLPVRSLAGLCVESVSRVRLKGFDPRQGDRILSLLTTRADSEGLDLVFADHAALRLETTRIAVSLLEFGEPWPAAWRPLHQLDRDGP